MRISSAPSARRRWHHIAAASLTGLALLAGTGTASASATEGVKATASSATAHHVPPRIIKRKGSSRKPTTRPGRMTSRLILGGNEYRFNRWVQFQYAGRWYGYLEYYVLGGMSSSMMYSLAMRERRWYYVANYRWVGPYVVQTCPSEYDESLTGYAGCYA